ncbi:cutinase family protein [Microbacterium terrae]|nr:cutinase family protein [Microbacterium terrae]
MIADVAIVASIGSGACEARRRPRNAIWGDALIEQFGDSTRRARMQWQVGRRTRQGILVVMTTAALVLGMGVGTATAATAFTKAPVPTISGTVKVGSTLTAAAGTWSPSATLSYQWKRNGTSISGATAKTYKLTTSDAGRTVAVTTTGKRSGYTTTSKTSAGTAVPTVAFTTAPTPTISGTSSVGSTLTATAGTWSPTATVSYQWRRNGTAIASATAKTYKLATADAGQKLTVTVTGKRTGYTTTAKTSAAKTIATLTFGTAPTPTISGTASVGSTLTANPGTWSPTATLSFQWKRSGAAISGATAKTYKLVAADAGASITVTVTGKKTGYTTAAKTSAAKTIAATAFTTAPTPTLSGTATVGSTLTANPGTWSPAATLTYQWKRNGSSISGAAAATYKLADADAGQSLTVTVTGARAGYATTARTSAAKAIPALAFTAAPTPTITGTAAVGSILTANAGTWSPTPTLAYQWNRNGIAISGATKTTYALVSADQGAMITVTVTASRSGYASTTRTSAVVTVPTGPGAAVVQISADITADTTWAPASSTVYLLTTQVDVRSGVTLTIGANAIVKARTNAGLAVEGALVVNGTAGNPVTFTSLRDDTIGGDSNSDGDVTTPQPGDWYGITISSKASMTATYATVKYASSGWQSSGADVFRLSHGAVSDTQYDGIRVAADRSGANAGNAIISITDTTVRRAGRNGITVSATGQPAGSGTQIPVPVVTDNTVTDSGKGYNNSSVPNQVAIRVHGYALDGSKLTGNDGNGNKISAIALSGTLKTNLSLPQGDLPLALLDSDYLTVAAGATLTIAAGQTVKAYQAGLAVEGSLVVNGTAGNPVTFTSLRDDTIGGDSNSDGDVTTPQPGDWYGITISNGGSVHGSGLSVRYASYGITAGQTSSLQLSDSGVSSTTSRCLDVTGADSASYFHGTVRDCEFGVFSSGLTYFDASAVDWGGDEPPGNGADERPRASGPGVDVFPWVGWVDPPPASKPKVYAASPCKDLLVIGVRGSGEEATSANRDMGNMVKTFHDAFVEELAEQSASPISTRTIGLEYPAYAVPLSSPDAPGLLTYTSGAWSGAVELMSTLENEIERCGSSGEKIVLNGYSQGAWVIHSTLAYMEKSKRLPVSNLAAVNLIADPQRAQLGAEYNAGSATGDTWGVANAQVVGVPAVRFSNWLAGSIYPEVRQFQASNVSSEDMITPVDIPTSLLSRVVTICNFTDPVCAIGGRGFPDADVHGEYPTSSGWARFVEESASTARIYAD